MNQTDQTQTFEDFIDNTAKSARELLRTVHFVYKGKTKRSLPVKSGRYHDEFWVSEFEIGQSDGSEQNDHARICEAYALAVYEIDQTRRLLRKFGDKLLTRQVRIGIPHNDSGNYIDVEAQEILEILNAPETKRVVELYLTFHNAKKALPDFIKAKR